MIRNSLTRIVAAAASVVVCSLTLSNSPSAERAQGQGDAAAGDRASRTVLADGRMLVAGGISAGRPIAEVFIEDAAGGRISLPALRWPRAGHTATTLADGRVLILGGVGRGGRLETHSEIFDPVSGTFSELNVSTILPRANHTATLLTDSRLLIAGGNDHDGRPLDTAQVWNPADGSSSTIPLEAGRSGHQARLQPDGTVLLTGGGISPEIYVPGAEVVVAGGEASPESPVAFSGSSPQDGAENVPADVRVALRFSGPLAAGSVGPYSTTLSSSTGAVAATITFAEGGRLLFVTPATALDPGERYILVTHGLRSADGTPLSTASISFTIAAQNVPSDGQSVDDVWRPKGDGRWRMGSGRSPWQDLPPLSAPDGTTAIAGQVLRLNGSPLAGVALEVEGHDARTDRSGRFLLRLDGAPSGRRVLEINGATANTSGRTYGFFEAGVQVVAGATTALPFTIWMPAIDTAHAVTIPSPTTQETIVTTPYIPGLELHLAPGTVIRDEEGNRVTRLSITPIPIDRTPFPLPAGVEVPIYFTIQPGGAYLGAYGSTSKGARLYYPNYSAQRAGTRFDFWHYDPDDRGWYIYGQGKVEASGRQVVPDPGIGIYQFTGAMVGSGSQPSTWPSLDGLFGGDPVDLASGLFVMHKTDLLLRDVLPIVLNRTYRPGDTASGSFGIGSKHLYDLRLWRPSLDNYDDVALILPDGARVEYDRIDGGTGFVDMVLEHTSSPTAFYKSRITWNGNGFDLALRDGTVLVFGDNAPLQSIRDRFGNTITLVRTTGQTGKIDRIISPNGRWIALTYDAAQRITQAADNIGRTVTYTYDSGRLWKVTDAAGGITEYTYDSSDRMLTIEDARGITYLTNTYDSNGRVATQTQADSGVFEFDYTLDGSGRVTQTDMTDPREYVQRTTFDSGGYHLTVTEALGTTLERTTTIDRDSTSHRVTSVTDPLNRETTYAYDSYGKVTSIVRLAGTTDALTTALTYEPAYQQLASVTDPLNHTTTFTYDYAGHLTAITDPLSHQTTFTYDASGQPLTMTNAENEAVTFGYLGGDLVSITSPLGHVTTLLTDGAGRVILVTDPSGRSTQAAYDALDLVTNIIDAMGNTTAFTYDENGNLLTLTDARSKTTTWTYDDMDRVATRTDPLTRAESFAYDLNGNVTSSTDRKGQVTTYTYDALNRHTFVGFGTTGAPPAYASSVTTTYDAGDRATELVDSAAGTISRTYDLLDRLTEEETPEGTINYTHDDAGRRTTMTVAGQTAVSYTYDNADRLTGVTQGTAAVNIAYDASNRRTSLTLPNGIVVESAYDDDSQLTGLTYKLSGTTIGDLTYAYDASGRRVSMGGSYARTNLPAALASATYDDANQIATWAGTSFTYDDNGNLTSDGSKSYSWNARNELTGISSDVSASFAYDAVGRRRSRTVGTTTTQFLYDGLNPVQELASGTPTANVLTGLSIDEYFTRTDSAGARHLLTDALGSTIALTDGSGSVQTEYAYEPFGSVATSGSSTTNSLGFTGRENDSTGLSYFRARYYDSRLQRFVSEDPIGFAAGDVNLQAYVSNAPTQWTDPSGLAYIQLPAGCRGNSGKNPPAWVRFLCTPVLPIPWPLLGPAGGAAGAAASAAGGAGGAGGAGAGAAAAAGAGGGTGSGAAAAAAAAAGPLSWLAHDLFTAAERDGLRNLFGNSVQGAQNLLGNLGRGAPVRLPPGVTPETLRNYRTLAEDAIGRGVDPLGVQQLRVQAINEILKRGGQ